MESKGSLKMENFKEVETTFYEKVKEFEKRAGVSLDEKWVRIMINLFEKACKSRDVNFFRFYVDRFVSVLSYFSCCTEFKYHNLVYEMICFFDDVEVKFLM